MTYLNKFPRIQLFPKRFTFAQKTISVSHIVWIKTITALIVFKFGEHLQGNGPVFENTKSLHSWVDANF